MCTLLLCEVRDLHMHALQEDTSADIYCLQMCRKTQWSNSTRTSLASLMRPFSCRYLIAAHC